MLFGPFYIVLEDYDRTETERINARLEKILSLNCVIRLINAGQDEKWYSKNWL